MAFSSTRWGSNAFFPAIDPRIFLLVQEYTTCWNGKSSMSFRGGSAQHSAIGMQLIATRFHDGIVRAGAATATVHHQTVSAVHLARASGSLRRRRGLWG